MNVNFRNFRTQSLSQPGTGNQAKQPQHLGFKADVKVTFDCHRDPHKVLKYVLPRDARTQMYCLDQDETTILVKNLPDHNEYENPEILCDQDLIKHVEALGGKAEIVEDKTPKLESPIASYPLNMFLRNSKLAKIKIVF